MPLGNGVRYRVTKNKGGVAVRLAFRGNTVIESKRMDPAPVRELRGAKRKAARRRKPGLTFASG